ncbi:hypothetical protein OG883_39695 [Streptomyces sp. NBC_01142]|uniref:hypothetical protein n=1 Tax=Streptomyces sp. NBC_01142 TaxID=2975865 RepID=UPI002250D223|nr:hypothetical protein [Streptomyces sp. NBC_01142]MCX4825839.1 hypothetical protein [Streptomyces sp. NBC_01142]
MWRAAQLLVLGGASPVGLGEILRDAQGPDTDPAAAARTATFVIARIRGLLLDLLAAGERDRVQNVAGSFTASLEQGRPAEAPGCAEPSAAPAGASRPRPIRRPGAGLGQEPEIRSPAEP